MKYVFVIKGQSGLTGEAPQQSLQQALRVETHKLDRTTRRKGMAQSSPAPALWRPKGLHL